MIVGIDPGHGGDNIGCAGFGVKEAHETLELALMLRSVLHALGLGCILSRTFNETVSLSQRAERLRGSNMVVSIHVNAGDAAAHDLRTYALTGDTLAEMMGLEIERIAPRLLLPQHARVEEATGRPANVLIQHRPTPALLVEAFFATHAESAQYAQTSYGRAAIVTAIAGGITAGWSTLSVLKGTT